MVGVVVLKNGNEYITKCDDFQIEKDDKGNITKILTYGKTSKELLWMAHSEIAAVYRIRDKEMEGEY